jgi:hypothetical protein
MALNDLYQAVDELSRDELEALSAYIQQREQAQPSPYTQEQRIEVLQQAIETLRNDINANKDTDTSGIVDEIEGYRRNSELDIDEIMGLFAELGEGFTEQDFEELEWAINTDYIEPLDDDE